MKNITFITGNPKKAEYLKRYIKIEVNHQKIDLEEIQSLDIREIVEHKVRSAFDQLKKPVLVEDVSLEFVGLGRLPGPFIKFFEKELGNEGLCRLLDGKGREARAKCLFGYFDGNKVEIFEGSIAGSIAQSPRGTKGFGWDQIFIPYFTDKTAAELDDAEYERFYTEEKPFQKVGDFLLSI